MNSKLKKFGEFINEEFITNNSYRVYKKSKEYYRIEEMIDGNWEEIEEDKDIENLLLEDCYLIVNERGRINTVEGSFKSSKDVPVHAWIECNSYKIGGELKDPDGILYYNPFTVKKFTDRESYELSLHTVKVKPLVIHKCDEIGIKGNYLEYKGATVTEKDKNVLVDKQYVTESIDNYELTYSPFKINESQSMYNIHWSDEIDSNDVKKYKDIVNHITDISKGGEPDSDEINFKKSELFKDIKDKYPNLYDQMRKELDEYFYDFNISNFLDRTWDELS